MSSPSLGELPQDVLDVIFGNLQAAEKALAWLARANKQLLKAVESSGSAYT